MRWNCISYLSYFHYFSYTFSLSLSLYHTASHAWTMPQSTPEPRQLVHVSCGRSAVWGVDSDGQVVHRIGTRAPSDPALPQAWLPVDSGDTVFTQVVACQRDWQVTIGFQWFNAVHVLWNHLISWAQILRFDEDGHVCGHLNLLTTNFNVHKNTKLTK